MKTITPHLWFDNAAKEAAEFYTSAFLANVGSASGDEASGIRNTTTLRDTPSGTVVVVAIELLGQEFTLISAGPYFQFTPAVSFLVACRSKHEVDALWDRLSEGGMALMELGEYPFSERYGWVQDRYGLSWQLMFVGPQCGKTEEAIHHYASVFRDAGVGAILRYGKGEGPDKEGTVKHAAFTLAGQDFAAMDSARAHEFSFNEAISFVVHCDTQEEVDYYWGKLSADPEAEQCGWLKDRYGLSWQIVPTALDAMLSGKDENKAARVTGAFLKMKKLDIEALKRAFEGY